MSKVELIPDDDGDGVGRAVRIGQAKRIIQSEAFSGTEGWHSYRIGDYYYLIAIGSPNGMWFRTRYVTELMTLKTVNGKNRLYIAVRQEDIIIRDLHRAE